MGWFARFGRRWPDARIAPDAVDFINAHATGTRVQRPHGDHRLQRNLRRRGVSDSHRLDSSRWSAHARRRGSARSGALRARDRHGLRSTNRALGRARPPSAISTTCPRGQESRGAVRAFVLVGVRRQQRRAAARCAVRLVRLDPAPAVLSSAVVMGSTTDFAAATGEPPHRFRRMDRYAALGYTAAHIALARAGIAPSERGDASWGILLGSSTGCWASIAEFFRDLGASAAPGSLSPAALTRGPSRTRERRRSPNRPIRSEASNQD